MIVPNYDVVGALWPDSETETRWVEQLERACRHLGGFSHTRVRTIIVAEHYRGGHAEVRAVHALAGRLAAQHGLMVSIVDHGDRLTVRLSRREMSAGD